MSDGPIIYRNEREDVIIIDIPRSIAAAQDFVDPGGLKLASCQPQLHPYESSEPKTSASAESVSNHSRDDKFHETYIDLIKHALIHCAEECSGESYCYPRANIPDGMTQRRKRSPGEAFGEGLSVNEEPGTLSPEDDLSARLQELPDHKSRSSSRHEIVVVPEASDLKHGDSQAEEPIDSSNNRHFFHNESEKAVALRLKHVEEESRLLDIRIPPKSSFLLGRCEDVANFRSASRLCFSETRGRFDFILLDPPWPNRSALRKSSYNTPSNLRDVKKLLLRMDLDTHIQPDGFIGVWITNKPAVRSMVLDRGGLFEAWNVGLVEEWVWVKVTSKGEPVTETGGRWRKPYEVLLVGKAPSKSLEAARTAEQVKRRVLVGVPDLHSRKPCLKNLIEELLLRRSRNYTALEIFARHLVAGWLSWGDEALKYNWVGYWLHSEDCKDS